LQIRGVDDEGLPYSLFKSISFKFNNGPAVQTDKEPYKYSNNKESFDKNLITAELNFHGHYGEPKYNL